MVLRLVREALESQVQPTVATSAMFDALEACAVMPDGYDEVVDFVAGPLRIALEKRIGEEMAESSLGEVNRLLAEIKRRGAPPSPPHGITVPPGIHTRGLAASPTDRATVEVSREAGPVRTLIVARNTLLAAKLRAALGGSRISVVAAGGADRVGRILRDLSPTVVVFDGEQIPDGEPDEMAAAFRHAPKGSLTVVWGSSDSRLAAIKVGLGNAGVNVITLDRNEGVEPLLDFFRARSA